MTLHVAVALREGFYLQKSQQQVNLLEPNALAELRICSYAKC